MARDLFDILEEETKPVDIFDQVASSIDVSDAASKTPKQDIFDEVAPAPSPLATSIRQIVPTAAGALDTASALAPNLVKGAVDTAEAGKRGLTHGTVGLAEAVNIGGQFLAGRAGSKTAQDFFKSGAKFWEDLGNEHAPPEELQGNILEKPELLGNAAWWAYNIGDTIPSLAASMAPGAAASKYISIGGRVLKWSPQVVARLARIGGSVAGGAVGGSLEGVQTYKEVLERGGTEGEAAMAGTVMSMASAVLNAVSLEKMFGKKTGSVLKYIADGATEGITELLEEPSEGVILSATEVARPEDAPLKRLREGINVLPVAAVTGGAASVAASRSKISEESLGPKAIEYLDTKFPNVSRVIKGKEIPGDVKTSQQIIASAAAKGEEVLLKGGTPEQAERAFAESLQEGLSNIEQPAAVEFEKAFTPSENLSEAQKQLESKGAVFAKANAEEILDVYEEKFGRYVSTDEMRTFLAPAGYTGELANEFHEPASALKNVYEKRLLKKAKKAGRTDVVLLAGGSGSGKSTYFEMQEKAGVVPDSVGAALDGTMENYDKAVTRIETLKKQGFKPRIEYVYRDPVEAWVDGVVPRFLKEGRSVRLDEHLRFHEGSFNNILKLAEKYGNEIDINLSENISGSGFNELNLEELERKRYDIEAVREVILDATEGLVKEGFLDQGQYQSLVQGPPALQRNLQRGRTPYPQEGRGSLEQRAKEEGDQPLEASEPALTPYEEDAPPSGPISSPQGTTPTEQPSLRGPRTLYPDAFEVRFKETGSLVIPNRKITSPADLAFAFRVLKDETQENFFLGAMKNGRIVAVEHLAFGTVDQVAVYPFETLNLLSKEEADEYFIVHNHPSGEINPSDEDQRLTRALKSVLSEAGYKFRGHVIIDTEKFGFIDGEGRISQETHQEYKRTKKVSVLRKYTEWLRPKEELLTQPHITNPKSVAELGKGIQTGKDEGIVYLLNVQNRILNAVVLPHSQMKEGVLLKLAAQYRSPSMILVNSKMEDWVYKYVQGVLRKADIRLLDDVSLSDDYSSYVSKSERGVAERWGEYGADQTETPEFKNWFGESKVVDQSGKPLVVYHGSGTPIEEFKYDFTNKGNDQLGSGFYFTTDRSEAEGYTTSRLRSDEPKLGGEGNPTVVNAYLSIKNPLDAETTGTVTTDHARRFIAAAPKKSKRAALENWAGVTQDRMIEAYAAEGVNVVRQLFSIANDFYGDNTEAFNRAVKKILGYDGIVKHWEGKDHYVAFFPEQIKSATGNRGTFDPNDPNILREPPRQYGGYPEEVPSDQPQQPQTREFGVIHPEPQPAPAAGGDLPPIIPTPIGQSPFRRKGIKEFTARYALARSLQRQAAAASQAARATTKELNALKKEIAVTAQKLLPIQERGWLNTVIASAKTSKDVAKATNRIYAKFHEMVRKDMVEELRSKAMKMIDSPSIDVVYRTKIGAVLEGFNFKAHRESTLQRLRDLERFVFEQKKEGKDVQMPQSILNSLRILHRKDVNELRIGELANLLNKIDLLANLGRQRVISREIQHALDKARWTRALVSAVKPIQTRELYEPPPGVSMTKAEYVGNKIRAAQNRALKIDFALAPMDAIMDVLDGVSEYQGPHSQMKAELDDRHNNYLQDKREWTRPVIELAEQLNLGENNFERIAVYAYRIQPNGRNYLLNNGLTDEQIDGIVLTENEMRLYKAMRDKIELPYADVVEVIRDIDNREVGKLQDYFPVQIDHDKVTDIELFQRMGDILDSGAFGLRTKTVQQGFTKARKGTKKAIKLNAMDTFLQHMDDVAYLVNTQRSIKLFSEVVNSPRYVEKAGDMGAFIMSQYMDTLARKGGGEGIKRINLLDTMRRNIGVATLGFKLSSILIQPTALMDGAARIGGGHVSRGLKDVVTSPEWRAFVRDNMPELRERGADDPAFQDLSPDKKIAKIQSLGYSYLKKADIITASAVAVGAYRKSLEARGIEVDLSKPDKQGILEAQRVVRLTQSSSFFKDLPQALTRGALTGNKSLDKAILQFRSFMLTRWSQIRHDFWRAGIKERNMQKATEIAFWLALANITETGIRTGHRFLTAAIVGGLAFALNDLDDDLEELPKNLMLEAAGNVPFIGDFVRAVDMKGRANLLPLARVPGDIITGTSRMVAAPNARGRKERMRRFAQGAVQVGAGIGAGLGIPGTLQAQQLLNEALKKKKNKLSLPRL